MYISKIYIKLIIHNIIYNTQYSFIPNCRRKNFPPQMVYFKMITEKT